MKYAVEMGSGAMIQQLIGRIYRHTDNMVIA
jgi:hypothetical protein